MTPKEVLSPTIDAVLAFLEVERDLLDVKVNERSLTHKLAEHLQSRFPDWNVDCEYNRLDEAVKVLPMASNVLTDDIEGRTIYPDIIVHKRRHSDNLLVIEVKKSTNNSLDDQEKLKGLTGVTGGYRYVVGLHIIINCAEGSISDATAYTDGERNEDVTAFVRKGLLG